MMETASTTPTASTTANPAAEAVLSLFHPLTRRWFLERVGTPTDIQIQAWPEIAAGRHVLVTAPTGSGKTLTAFLWAINTFLTHPQQPERRRVLYISPLKALNNDIQRNLEKPLQELREYFLREHEPFPEIRVAVRSGDTDPGERRRMLHTPPEILITTPESLNVLLTSQSGARLLSGFSTIILDEIHAVADGKRGVWLITAIERLVPLCGEFQRIALSATIKPLNTVADFIGGFTLQHSGSERLYHKRPVTVLQSHIRKQYDIRVDFSNTDSGSDQDEWQPGMTESFKKIIRENHTTLFFANSRRMVEKVARLLNENGEDVIYSHHGALAREIRAVVEKRFKDGELPAIIATSSLELGIDIGSVDQVVLTQPPFSIASAIQRLGRAGHGVGQISRGIFYPIHARALMEAAVIAAQIDSGSVEAIKPLEAPLDVLAQILLSMSIREARSLDTLYDEIRCAYPYRRLNRSEFDLVVEMLAGRYAASRIRELKPRILLDRMKGEIQARENSALLLYQSGGVIPDRGYFNLRVADSRAKIGELDEEFVWERSLGDAFPLGNRVWRIQRITHNDVEVSPVEKTNSLIPFWRADELNRSWHLSEKIGRFLETAQNKLDKDEDDFRQLLQNTHHLTPAAAQTLISYLKRQQNETRVPLPHRRHIVVEHFNDPVNQKDTKQTVIHTLWGGPVNRPLAFALSAAWEEKYQYPLEVFANNDCIMLNLPHAFTFSDILTLLKPSRIRPLLRAKLESTGYFGARFRENAQRALLLPKTSFNRRLPLWLNRLRSKKLLDAISQYEDFPILLETWRECLNTIFEMETLTTLLEELLSGEVRVSETITHKPSPFAEGIIWRMTNQYMYEDDSPRSKLRTRLNDSLLKEVLYSSHLRPRFPGALLETMQAKLHRLAPGYAPDSPEELLQWVRERLFIPIAEWEALLKAIKRDTRQEASELVKPVENRLWFLNRGETPAAVLALENLPRTSRALGLEQHHAIAAEAQMAYPGIETEDASPPLTRFLSQWLRYYGPVPAPWICGTLGVPEEKLDEALALLLEEGRALLDEFRLESPGLEEICDAENLEILLRLRRAGARPILEPLDLHALPLFLAHHQGLTTPGDAPDSLQSALEKLFGYPAKAAAWETDIFPARMHPYFPSWLDNLTPEHSLMFYGCGPERLSFCFENDLDLFNNPGEILPPPATEPQEPESADSSPDNLAMNQVLEFLQETGGKFTLEDLMRGLGLSSDTLTQILWVLTWRGRVSNDSFRTIRAGIIHKFTPARIPGEAETPGKQRRLGFNRWNKTRTFTGNWFLLPETDPGHTDAPEPPDALDRMEMTKDRIRLLLMRYGVLFRELLWNETPLFRWSRIFPVLRLMELSGEIVSGQFFRGVLGLQFAAPAIASQLAAELPEDAIFWMNASDPASLCGIPLEELKPALPHRLATTHLVFHGRRLILVSRKNGRELTIDIPPHHPRILECLEFFKVLIAREFLPLKRVELETINNEPALNSPYKDPLIRFGFQKDYKSLTLIKKY